jgi:outer membrane immunogenic protein
MAGHFEGNWDTPSIASCPYVTGGVAFVDYEGGSSIFFSEPIFPSTAYSETKAGWTVGAGLAFAMTHHLIANIDYRYADFGSSAFATPGAFLGQTKLDLKENAIKIGPSYKF